MADDDKAPENLPVEAGNPIDGFGGDGCGDDAAARSGVVPADQTSLLNEVKTMWGSE